MNGAECNAPSRNTRPVAIRKRSLSSSSIVLSMVVLVLGCAAGKGTSVNSDAASTTEVSSSGADGGGAVDSRDSGATEVLEAGVDACSSLSGFSPSLVCFGSEPIRYQQYLVSSDGGAGPGECPSDSDFIAAAGEGRCGYSACGPLSPSAIARLSDAGYATSDAGTDCCFLVVPACGA